jgi:hypothetical protein
METAINQIALDAGLRIALSSTGGAIRCVGTLRNVYKRAGDKVLGQTLRVIYNSFGDAAFHAIIVNGISLVLQRYADQLSEVDVTERLMEVRGGVNSLMTKAEQLHKQTNNAKGHCVAAVVVDILNQGLGGRDSRRLTPWWSGKRK